MVESLHLYPNFAGPGAVTCPNSHAADRDSMIVRKRMRRSVRHQLIYKTLQAKSFQRRDKRARHWTAESGSTYQHSCTLHPLPLSSQRAVMTLRRRRLLLFGATGRAVGE